MVDVVVTGRHLDVPAKLRAYAQDKLAKVEKLCPKAIRLDVEFSRERNPRLSEIRDQIQLTCVSRGPAVRAEAAADDMFAAFDLAWEKLEARLRRAADRRRVHRGARTPVSVAAATAAISAEENNSAAAGEQAPDDDADRFADLSRVTANGPMLVREKLHVTEPMTLDQALYEMELVGHDFFLFFDKETERPSVVYRRKAFDYGLLRLT